MTKKIMQEVFDYDDSEGQGDEDTVALAVEVDESKTDKVKGGKKTFDVKGIEEF